MFGLIFIIHGQMARDELASRGRQALWPGLLVDSAQAYGERVDSRRLLLQSVDLPLLRNELLL